MPYYAESPLERITDVHWKKKDGGVGPPGNDPCGALVISANPSLGVSRWFPTSFTPCALGLANTRGAVEFPIIDPFNPVYLPYNLIYSPFSFGNENNESFGFDNEYNKWICGGGQRGYTVTLEGGSNHHLIIDVFNDVGYADLTLEDEPSETYEADSFVTAEIQGNNPIVSLRGWTWFYNPGGGRVAINHWGGTNDQNRNGFVIKLTFQVHCEHETKDAPPPQPPGNGWRAATDYTPPPPFPGGELPPPRPPGDRRR